METPTAKEIALLNSCLGAIADNGAHVAQIAHAAGVSNKRAQRALDLLEEDGVIYSFSPGLLARKYYARRPEENIQGPPSMPWCEQCDCHHYMNAPCVDEVR